MRMIGTFAFAQFFYHLIPIHVWHLTIDQKCCEFTRVPFFKPDQTIFCERHIISQFLKLGANHHSVDVIIFGDQNFVGCDIVRDELGFIGWLFLGGIPRQNMKGAQQFALFDCLQTQRLRLQLDQMKLVSVHWA